MLIYCTTCRGERTATKVYGLGGGWVGRDQPHWLNECCNCGTLYAALPPAAATVRRKLRAYARASRQLELCR